MRIFGRLLRSEIVSSGKGSTLNLNMYWKTEFLKFPLHSTEKQNTYFLQKCSPVLDLKMPVSK